MQCKRFKTNKPYVFWFLINIALKINNRQQCFFFQMDPQWEEESSLCSMSHNIVVKGRLKRGKWHFGIQLQQWNSSALMSHKTSSKHGFSIWERLHAESSALTVHERACSLRTSLPDTRKNKLAFKLSTAKDMQAKGGKQQATNLCRSHIRTSVNTSMCGSPF